MTFAISSAVLGMFRVDLFAKDKIGSCKRCKEGVKLSLGKTENVGLHSNSYIACGTQVPKNLGHSMIAIHWSTIWLEEKIRYGKKSAGFKPLYKHSMGFVSILIHFLCGPEH